MIMQGRLRARSSQVTLIPLMTEISCSKKEGLEHRTT
jgi:hypothetical protein